MQTEKTEMNKRMQRHRDEIEELKKAMVALDKYIRDKV